jgi:hypothetical protein
MSTSQNVQPSNHRFGRVSEAKAWGATYTPTLLSDFVGRQIVLAAKEFLSTKKKLRVLDPAIGDGQLLFSLMKELGNEAEFTIEVTGFETSAQALSLAEQRLKSAFPNIELNLRLRSFLDFVPANEVKDSNLSLFEDELTEKYDLIIANPPYVRTQIMGAEASRSLAKQFGFSGRVDLYFPFVLGMVRLLSSDGVAGIIVSNRFMTTRAGASLRRGIRDTADILHVWDLGDTKIFGAAILPAVLLLQPKRDKEIRPKFTSIYETSATGKQRVTNPIEALSRDGIVQTEDGRSFDVLHGALDISGRGESVWRISTQERDRWLRTVKRHIWGTFRDIGKVRVGVKTCADNVFIRSDWQEMPVSQRPELIRPILTHHLARRYRALRPHTIRQIVYPHESFQGRRQAVDLTQYPRTRAYLEKYRQVLEERTYVTEAGRKWYEIWVPQDPSTWELPKLVFRDISKKPTFWVDLEGSIVNGDCYWIAAANQPRAELLWLAAAVGNSTFIERFYDLCFHNKLYAGRRRFISQYVEQFPLPNPECVTSRLILTKVKELFNSIDRGRTEELEHEIDQLVWRSFGLDLGIEEI